jgi:squalene-associated FAD-dependent desaturase
MTTASTPSTPHVAIVGGGLAGLAAAVVLVQRGCHVELFEARRRLGGRAGSYVDRAGGEQIDHCQHVAMGCCTNYLDFCHQTGIADLFERHEKLHFFGPDSRRSDFHPSRWLPAPLHLAGPLLGLKFLTPADKLGIARSMLRLMRTTPTDAPGGPSVYEWLQQDGQNATAIERFWQVVLVSALGESLDRASLAAARKVFLDGFLAHRDACHVIIPRVSLGELYDVRVAEWLRTRGVVIHIETAVTTVIGIADRVSGIRLADDSERQFDFVILAVPWQRVSELLSPELCNVIDPHERFASLTGSPITGVHLWFDRQLTDLPHAVLVGRLAQWIFSRRFAPERGEYYYQVVISASRNLAGRDRQAVIDEVLADLRAVFPAAYKAKLVRWQLITEQDAVFSIRPGTSALRPAQQTPVPNLLLAGDWTATSWPATMEGAVRSGYLAAEALLVQVGRPERIVVPDLPRGWLVRFLQGWHP